MSKPLTRPIIERARALIADEHHWCRAALAKDERGRQVDPTDLSARQRCAFGALIAAAFELVVTRNRPTISQGRSREKSGAARP